MPDSHLTTTVIWKRALPEAGGHTLFFHAPRFGKSGVFLESSAVPEFDGEAAEVEYERAGCGRIRVIRIIQVTKAYRCTSA